MWVYISEKINYIEVVMVEESNIIIIKSLRNFEYHQYCVLVVKKLDYVIDSENVPPSAVKHKNILNHCFVA